jgi:hypothetical protein
MIGVGGATDAPAQRNPKVLENDLCEHALGIAAEPARVEEDHRVVEVVGQVELMSSGDSWV